MKIAEKLLQLNKENKVLKEEIKVLKDVPSFFKVTSFKNKGIQTSID